MIEKEQTVLEIAITTTSKKEIERIINLINRELANRFYYRRDLGWEITVKEGP